MDETCNATWEKLKKMHVSGNSDMQSLVCIRAFAGVQIYRMEVSLTCS